MRGTAIRLAGAVSLAIIAAAVLTRGTAQPAIMQPLTLTTADEHRVVLAPGPSDLIGYWGAISGAKTGSYRATCAGLGETARISCSVELSFTDGTTLIAQGLVNRPPTNVGLFERWSDRPIAVPGGTGVYKAKQGYADLKHKGLVINLVP
jgi:hypothetical protein